MGSSNWRGELRLVGAVPLRVARFCVRHFAVFAALAVTAAALKVVHIEWGASFNGPVGVLYWGVDIGFRLATLWVFWRIASADHRERHPAASGDLEAGVKHYLDRHRLAGGGHVLVFGCYVLVANRLFELAVDPLVADWLRTSALAPEADSLAMLVPRNLTIIPLTLLWLCIIGRHVIERGSEEAGATRIVAAAGEWSVMTVSDDVTRADLNGPLEKVFDLITQGRWWKEWHVSSTGVGGVTERPYLLGDVVQETGEVNDRHFTLSWRVVAHERPTRVVLHEENLDAYLVYTFEETEDGRTRYTRGSQLDNAERLRALGLDPETLRRDTAEASAASITRLQDHINGILAAERHDMHVT